ncbi:uncharacterized protein, partial [Diadema antillarum]|uniref:uncharacterized protein n=1 Tax=Diadema antillarum TaxID=105358 RepID=UPI003A83610F
QAQHLSSALKEVGLSSLEEKVKAAASEPTERCRVLLWSVPRAGSTALAKCLTAIPESEVWYEPYFYSYTARAEYKANLNEELPLDYAGHEKAFQKVVDLLEILEEKKLEPERLPYAVVKRQLESTTSKHVIVKDIGLAVAEGLFDYLPDGFKHTFLIRHPVRYISSYRRAAYKQYCEMSFLDDTTADEKKYDVERDDRFFTSGAWMKELYDLWNYVKENVDSDPVIIDTDDLLTKPAETLRAYCKAVGLPYSESLLEWSASTDSLKTWKAAGDSLVTGLVKAHRAAMKSSEFLPPSKFPDQSQLTPDVIRCTEGVMKYYNEMHEHRLKV